MKSSLALLFALSLGTAADAQTLSQAFAFGCPGIIQPCADGAEPGSIIQASDGNLYGLSSSSDGYHSTKDRLLVGTYTLTITGTSGSLTHSTSVNLIVRARQGG